MGIFEALSKSTTMTLAELAAVKNADPVLTGTSKYLPKPSELHIKLEMLLK